ncbi:MAG: phosphotransferase [Treponemataceae bacterium]|nr:phosphotransferase [Treponemataceae bacterium]
MSFTLFSTTLEHAKKLYSLQDFDFMEISGHEGGRNQLFVCSKDNEKKYVLRVSSLGDRTEQEYLAETEFVHYLAENGAAVADVIPSVNGKFVEIVDADETKGAGDAHALAQASGDAGKAQAFISLFEYAKGMLLCDNGYRYRDGAPLEEYFYNTGKTLGKIHALSKRFTPTNTNCRRASYFEKYNMDYINRLIPDKYDDLKNAIAARLCKFQKLPTDTENFGLVHFDYSDGNYHIDMKTGDITVFDFDNCMYCWYMFDLANLWTHGEGWCRYEPDAAKRESFMKHYFETILEGYRSETPVAESLVEQLPLFIGMVLIENIVDEFECYAREGEELDFADIEYAANWLINNPDAASQ